MADARPVPVALSTASVYPAGTAAAFEYAAELGYDGVEVMGWNDPISQSAKALNALAEHHGLDIVSIHAPTLLLTQRVLGTEAWGKVDRSIERPGCPRRSAGPPAGGPGSRGRPRGGGT